MSAKALIRDGLAATLLALGVTEPGKRGSDRLFIATFHRVLPTRQREEYPLPGLAVTPEDLDWFVRFFQQHFECQRLDVAWQEHAEGKSSGRPRLAITFDDGQLDNYLHAAPVLDRLGVPGTFFIPVAAVESQTLLWHDRMGYAIRELGKRQSAAGLLKRVGLSNEVAVAKPHAGVVAAKDWDQTMRDSWIEEAEASLSQTAPAWDGMMSWDQIRELAARGHEIGSHSYTHPLLVQCDERQLEHEIIDSKQRLEQETGQAIRSFCYPNGTHDARVVDCVQRAGYTLAVTTRWGSNAPGTGAYQLQRHDMVSANSTDRLGRLSPARLAMRMSGLAKGV